MRQCNYTVSLYKGTFLDKTHLPPWEVSLFVNHWLQKTFDHDFFLEVGKLYPPQGVRERPSGQEALSDSDEATSANDTE